MIVIHTRENIIGSSDENASENTFDSIRSNRECDSNEMDESDLQSRKYDKPRVSTLHGPRIDS
jgi:hypothetical protein